MMLNGTKARQPEARGHRQRNGILSDKRISLNRSALCRLTQHIIQPARGGQQVRASGKGIRDNSA
ncbi:hypothetical protein C1N58_12160 [Pantoea sp. SGAir0180]|nr:hypothetical protein NS381_01335 [Pantoea stewartii]